LLVIGDCLILLSRRLKKCSKEVPFPPSFHDRPTSFFYRPAFVSVRKRNRKYHPVVFPAAPLHASPFTSGSLGVCMWTPVGGKTHPLSLHSRFVAFAGGGRRKRLGSVFCLSLLLFLTVRPAAPRPPQSPFSVMGKDHKTPSLSGDFFFRAPLSRQGLFSPFFLVIFCSGEKRSCSSPLPEITLILARVFGQNPFSKCPFPLAEVLFSRRKLVFSPRASRTLWYTRTDPPSLSPPQEEVPPTQLPLGIVGPLFFPTNSAEILIFLTSGVHCI